RAQRDARAVVAGAAAALRADARKALRDCQLVEPAGAARQHRIGHRREALAPRGIEPAAGVEIEAHVEHRDRVGPHEEDARTVRGGPVLDRQRGARRAGQRRRDREADRQQPKGESHGGAHWWRAPAGGARRGASLATGCGNRAMTVSASSPKYLLATACTSAAVTARMRSRMRSASRCEKPATSSPPISMACAITESRL